MNKKNIAVLAIFLITCLLLVLLVIRPLINEIRQEAGNFISQKRTIIELSNRAENLKKFQATYHTYQSDLEKIEKLFIDSREPVNFIEFLESEAVASQLLIEISPVSLKEIEDDIWLSMNFQLSLSGAFPSFLGFLQKLETNSYLIDVLNLSASRLTGETAGDITASLLIKVYTQGQ